MTLMTLCRVTFRNNPVQIGGPGHIVEIDESLFSRRKYNRGRIVPEQWIFVGYDAATKESFLLPVSRRNVATLMPLIIHWVRPGTEIWSDMWGAYNGIAAQGFQHDVVNHQYNFVDPNTGVTTNYVEEMWQRAKAKFKSMFGLRKCNSAYICKSLDIAKQNSVVIMALKCDN